MSFRPEVHRTSQFKRFSNPNIAKTLAKENVAFNFIVRFTLVKALVFSLKHQKMRHNRWLYIYSLFFSFN